MTTDNKHKWECISPGEYDTTYRCSKCGALHTDQADDPSSLIPEFGCPVSTDLKSKTPMQRLCDLYRDVEYLSNNNISEVRAISTAYLDVARRLEESQKKIVAQEAKDNYVGRWLSAALDDPSVCEEMKADIRLWMASDAVALTAHDAELTAKAKAEALEWAALAYPGNGEPIYGWLKEKAAEYRAKAGRKE